MVITIVAYNTPFAPNLDEIRKVAIDALAVLAILLKIKIVVKVWE